MNGVILIRAIPFVLPALSPPNKPRTTHHNTDKNLTVYYKTQPRVASIAYMSNSPISLHNPLRLLLRERGNCNIPGMSIVSTPATYVMSTVKFINIANK